MTDDDWKKLEKVGWHPHWEQEQEDAIGRKSDAKGDIRFLGALASSACGMFYSEEEAISAFEAATGQSFATEGCSCCGPPHSLYQSGDGKDCEWCAEKPIL